MQSPSPKNYDCIILGSGIGGSMLGAILARNGLNVLMLDSETHPRFAIGEATTPDTNLRLKLLSLKYDLPEIGHLSAFEPLRDNVSPACGVKRAFSFLYHRDGQDQQPLESQQYPTLAPPMGADCHFFRQDTDAYMMTVALKYGARVRQQTRVAEIDFGEDSVSVTTQKGETFTATYLVDATGMRSVLAEKLQLRGDSSQFRTNSRAIYTHMVGVKPYDQVGAPRSVHGLKYPLAQSTLHHIFEGGWFWVIPFDNHKDSTNPLCSVGLVLNREIHPETGMDPEEEFWTHVRRFPAMVRQFEKAQAVRGWVSTGRLQYGSRTITGHRYCLLSHAGFFIDPLYSSGLALTTATVDLLSGKLLAAFRANDFAVENFESLNEFFHKNISYFDSVVGSSFVAFRDAELWDAWFRVWVVALLIGTELNANTYLSYVETKDPAVLEQSGREPNTILLGGGFPEWREVYEKALAQMDRVRAGEVQPKAAAAMIRGLFKGLPYVPTYFRWHDPAVRTTPAFTVWGMTRMYFWYFFKTPRAMRKRLYNWSPFTGYGVILKSLRENSRLARNRKRRYERDVFKAWNEDWTEAS
ncbi:MAG TPA: tryptophan 7-halogenase [Thermoanaerobaculia bacterium]|nr:tryptophan 7-halogenase [Thermoanaerobaculia bacterium]